MKPRVAGSSPAERKYLKCFMVSVAQFGRVPDCDSGSRGFESHRSPKSLFTSKYPICKTHIVI